MLTSTSLAGTTAAPEPRIHLVFSSCSSESYSSSGDDGSSSPSHPSSSSAHSDEDWDSDELAASPAKFLFSARNPRPRRRRNGTKPSRRLTGDSEASLAAEAAAERIADLSQSDSPSPSPAASSVVSPASADGEVEGDASDAPASESGEPALPSGEAIEFEGAGPHAKGLLRRMYGVGASSNDSPGSESEASAVEVTLKDLASEGQDGPNGGAPSEGLKRVESAATLRPAYLRSLPAATVSSSADAVPDVDDLNVKALSLAQLEKMKIGESEIEKRRSRELKEKRSRKSLRREEEAEEGDDEGKLKRGISRSNRCVSRRLLLPSLPVFATQAADPYVSPCTASPLLPAPVAAVTAIANTVAKFSFPSPPTPSSSPSSPPLSTPSQLSNSPKSANSPNPSESSQTKSRPSLPPRVPNPTSTSGGRFLPSGSKRPSLRAPVSGTAGRGPSRRSRRSSSGSSIRWRRGSWRRR